MRIAVTGSRGRLGSALMTALGEAPFSGPAGPIGWSRPGFDLDRAAEVVASLLDRDRPEVVIHAAAWTDVDGCALDPALARSRNAAATGELARACAGRGVDLILMSTNEVFDGCRTDGQGYAPDDPVMPANAYGASKLEGERQATEAFTAGGGQEPGRPVRRPARLAIVRTAWLFGPGEPDFPRKILRAAAAAQAAGSPLRVVADEWGTPTFSLDLAEAIVRLLAEDALTSPGQAVEIHHVVGTGVVSRAAWARDTLSRVGIDLAVEEVPGSSWQRPSTPPSWAVLTPTALPDGELLRPWQAAMAEDAPALRR
ncbi:MAG: sugar nucleotide-binding protein, partial [Chloroflexi bacterium]|nr:sugar nucleotide-binding protein [Chloroflexota bacterium]